MFTFAVLLALGATPAEGLERSAGVIIREEALTVFYKKKSFPVKLAGFSGTISPVDAEKTFQVTARDVSLKKDSGSVSLTVSGEWLLRGKLDLGAGAKEMSLRVRATVEAPLSASLLRVRDAFVVRPAVGEVSLTKLEVVSVDPEPFPGAKGLLPAGLKSVWELEKKGLRKLVRDRLKDVEIPQPKFVLPASGTNDNKVLRQYVQSMIATRAAEYDGPKAGLKFDESFPYVQAAGGVWLDDPARRLKVSVNILELHEGVLYWGGEVEAPLRGTCRITIPDTVTGTTDFFGVGRVRFGGDLQFKDGEPAGCNVYALNAALADFSVGAAPFRIVRRVVERVANRFADDVARDQARKIEKLGGGPNRQRLVEAAYLRALGRRPGADGLRTWAPYLDRHTPREMLAAVLASPEYGLRLKGKDAGGVVREMWRTALGREPVPVEVERWSKWLGERVTVYEDRRVRVGLLRRETRRVPVGVRTRSYRDVAPILANCDEYRARFGEGLPR